MALDPTTSLGKVRLRIGDYSDLPILPDAVINAALSDCSNNIPRTAKLCAQYILATLTARVHRKLPSIETWSNEQFKNYIEFIKTTILNPNMMEIAPVPYVNVDEDEPHPLIKFVEDWNEQFAEQTYSDGGLF